MAKSQIHQLASVKPTAAGMASRQGSIIATEQAFNQMRQSGMFGVTG